MDSKSAIPERLKGVTKMLATLTLVPAAVGLMVATESTRSVKGSPERAVQVRFSADLIQRMDRVEALAWAHGRRDVTRSGMIREALTAYLDPLVALLNEAGQLDVEARGRFESPEKAAAAFGEAVRVRLDEPLLRNLDQVEAYARSLQYRNVTRSWLIRSAMTAYLDGFDSELLDRQRSAVDDALDESDHHKIGDQNPIRRRA